MSAGTSDASQSRSIRVRKKTGSDCVKCTAQLGAPSNFIVCFLCMLPQHLTCIENSLKEDTVKECKASNKQCYFFCMECNTIALALKPGDRKQIIDHKLQIQKLTDEANKRLKKASDIETEHVKEIATLRELHDESVRRYNALQTSSTIMKTELDLLQSKIDSTVASQCAEINTRKNALEVENASLRKLIDDNNRAYETELKRVQQDNAIYLEKATIGNEKIKQLTAQSSNFKQRQVTIYESQSVIEINGHVVILWTSMTRITINRNISK